MSRREDVRYIALSIAEIVDGVILHAQRMLDEETYDWPKTRAALEGILADLEAQSAGDPGIERLRGFIAAGDEVWRVRYERGHWFRRKARTGLINRGHWWRREIGLWKSVQAGPWKRHRSSAN